VLVQLFSPKSVVDVGCGAGSWLAEFQALGVDVTGYEGPWIRSAELDVPRHVIIEHDVTTSMASPRTFDLVLSLETAEHLTSSATPTFVNSLVALGPLIVFSAAIPRQGGTDHVNERWPARWVELFADHNYVAIDCLRSRFWENDAVAWWYAQNMLVFVHRDQLPLYQHLTQQSSSPLGTALALIHPRHYLALHDKLDDARQCADLSQRGCVEMMAALPAAARRAITARLREALRAPAR